MKGPRLGGKGESLEMVGLGKEHMVPTQGSPMPTRWAPKVCRTMLPGVLMSHKAINPLKY